MNVSLICACKNRYNALRISLNSWLAFDEIKEIIIVDWDSDESISHLSKLDERIKIIEVKNKKYFNQPQPLNLAASIATGDYILKVDCDYIINPYYNFFKNYTVDKETFICGKSNYQAPEYYSESYGGYVLDMEQMKPNEIVEYTVSYSPYFKFLIGLLLISKENFLKCGGYNENLTKCYAFEDEEFYERLKLMGLREIRIKHDYNAIHLPHPDKKRIENFEGFSWESDFVKMVEENMRNQGHTEQEVQWQVEYARAQKHIDQNKEYVGEITEYYVQPKTNWRIHRISESIYNAIEVLPL